MMSNAMFNTFFANSNQLESANAIYAEQSSGISDSTTEGYYVYPIFYPVPLYYNLYSMVTPVEDNGTTFYYYQRYAVPLYIDSYDQVTPENEFPTDVYRADSPADFPNENMEHEAAYSDSYDEVTPDIDFPTHDYSVESPADFPNENVEQETEFRDFYDEVTPDIDFPTDDYSVESPADFPNENVEQETESRKLCLNETVEDILSSSEGEKKEKDVSSEKAEDTLDSSNSSLALPSEDISPLIDKCHGDYEKEFQNDDAVKKSPSSSIREKHSQKESNEGSNDDFLNDSIFDNIEDQEFKVEASYCCQMKSNEDSNDEFLKDSIFDNFEDQEFKVEASYCIPSEKESLRQSSCIDLDEDNFNSSFPSRKVFKKLRHFKAEIEILPTIYEEDEPSEEYEELSEGSDEVEPSKNQKKKRFQRIRRWFSQLTSCCRKNREPPG